MGMPTPAAAALAFVLALAKGLLGAVVVLQQAAHGIALAVIQAPAHDRDKGAPELALPLAQRLLFVKKLVDAFFYSCFSNGLVRVHR